MSKTQDEIDEQPASVIATTVSGNKYDLNNMPGKLKKLLILEGEADQSTFQSDGDNIPGSKRKQFIEQRAEQEKQLYSEVNKDTTNLYKVGDVVKFKKIISEVLESDSVKGVKITLSNGMRSKWIHHSLVKVPVDKE